MRRWLPLLILAILLQPLAATAEDRAYGKAGVRTAQLRDASAFGSESPAVLTVVDWLVAASTLRDPPGRPLVETPRTFSLPFRPLRGSPPSVLRVTFRVGECPPHCERLPYHATAPPLR